jgi:hypothetical protein
MKYILKNEKTNEQEEYFSSFEREEIIHWNEWNPDDCISYQLLSCRGCSEYIDGVQERYDYHGISTGHYCHDCYENNYPYRKDAYPTIETHGYGERLNDDY